MPRLSHNQHIDPSERVKKNTRMALYTIIKEFKGKKIEEKCSLLEERLAQLTSCPPAETSVLTRSLNYFKTSFELLLHLAYKAPEVASPNGRRQKCFERYKTENTKKF